MSLLGSRGSVMVWDLCNDEYLYLLDEQTGYIWKEVQLYSSSGKYFTSYAEIYQLKGIIAQVLIFQQLIDHPCVNLWAILETGLD